MDIELWSISHAVRDFFLGASTLLLVSAIAWRLAIRPTVRAILELRSPREDRDGTLARRLMELEDEVRGLKAALPATTDPLDESLRAGPFVQRSTREKL